MADPAPVTAADDYIETELTRRLKAVEAAARADVIICIHPILQPFDDFVRQTIEDIPDRQDDLLVILETEGGSIETTERIADVFRHHYKGSVSFLVPNYAMSAGTILVMSGDRILMDYYSILGPIDPQIQNSDGHSVPALGYLEKFNQLVAKSEKGLLSQAELAFLLAKFDPAELHRFEQAREHSVDLLKQWLVKYKFKNWTETLTRKIAVNESMKVARAREIAKKLNNTKMWRSHGRGLSMEVIRNTLNLVVEDFGTDAALSELNREVRAFYRLLQDYMQRRGWTYVVQTRSSRFAF